MERRDLLVRGGLAVAVVAALLVGAYLFFLGPNFQQPQVVSVDSSFANVSEESATIDSRVVVRNPNEKALPGTVDLTYTVKLNDVAVASGTRSGLKLEPGRNVLEVTAAMDSGQIPAWWVSHVRNGGNTTMTIEPRVSFTGVPLGTSLSTMRRPVQVRVLGPVSEGATGPVVAANRTILDVTDRNTSWGEATDEATPIVVTSRFRNRHDHPVGIDGTAYEIRMNGVVVGEGRTNDSFRLAPDETAAFTTTAAIDPQAMQDWWVSHLRNDQRTELSVAVFALVDDDGELVRVPVAMFRQRSAVTTDMLGSANGTVEPLPVGDDGAEIRRPTTGTPDSDWGEVGEETTEIVTTVPVANPSGEAVSRLLDVRASHVTTINGVRVADGSRTTDGLAPGNSTLDVVSRMAHDTVPRWWARHLNRGERSTVNTSADASVDVGVTTFDVGLDAEDRVVETAVLSGYNSTTDQPIGGLGGSPVTVARTTAVWGRATPSEAPIEATVVLENNRPREVTIRDVNYSASLNGVVLADEALDRTVVLGPFERREVTFEPTLDNARMAAWWPTHVRNGERSTLRSESWATVAVGGRTDRVRFDALGGNRTVTTDVLVDRNDDR